MAVVWRRWRPRVPLPLLRGASAGSAACGLALSVERSQRTGNRRASARTRHPPATNPPSRDDLDRSALPRGGQPGPAAYTLAVLHHHTGDAVSLASAFGREAVDVRAAKRLRRCKGSFVKIGRGFL